MSMPFEDTSPERGTPLPEDQLFEQIREENWRRVEGLVAQADTPAGAETPVDLAVSSAYTDYEVPLSQVDWELVSATTQANIKDERVGAPLEYQEGHKRHDVIMRRRQGRVVYFVATYTYPDPETIDLTQHAGVTRYSLKAYLHNPYEPPKQT